MNTTQNTRFTAMCKAYDAYRNGDIEGDDLASTVVDYTDEVKLATERTYTRAEVVAAVSAGADMTGYGDLQNLIVNAQLTLLDTPGATLDDVILANWEAETEDETDEELIERVKGWSDLS